MNVFRYPIICIKVFAALAQLVERFHGKEEVAGSSPASGFLKQSSMLFYQHVTLFFYNRNKSLISSNKKLLKRLNSVISSVD